MKTVARALLRDEEGKFLVVPADEPENSWSLPGIELNDVENRKRRLSISLNDMGIETENPKDVVRIATETDDNIERYVIYFDDFSGEIEEGRWVTGKEFLELEESPEAGLYIVPMCFLDSYLETEANYGVKGHELDVEKTLVSDGSKLLMLKKARRLKVSSSEVVDRYGEMSKCWEQPGGIIEDDENRFEAAKRELKEETSLEVKELKGFMRMEIEHINTVKCYILFTESFSGEVELSKEHTEFRWIEPKEFRGLEWHRDAGYGIAAIENLDLLLRKNYNRN
ncbi:MAG: NUDIX domain-containing protein [Nanohaloarchaea archaeon]|nr:NUDIX domain-containing protein [Candidatus Nanohaloarchaea archaeon]